MDDNSASGCENNLQWRTDWYTTSSSTSGPTYNFSAGISSLNYSATNDLGYGLELSSSQGVIDKVQPTCSGPCPPVHAERTSSNRGIKLTSLYSNNNSGFTHDFEFVECTTKAHCTTNSDAVPEKAICNLGLTTDFLQNTCISSVPPTSKIIGMTATSGEIGYRPEGLAKHAGLRADNDGWSLTAYTFWVSDDDNDGNALTSNLSKCFVDINGSRRDRTCNAEFTVTVGRAYAGATCTVPGLDKCTIRVGGISTAGVETTNVINLSAHVTSNEKDFLGKNFNEISFDIDWESPVIPNP